MTEPRRRIEVAEAQALIHQALGTASPRWGTAVVSVAAAAGEILQQELRAERDQPPFDRVTMDGIALRHAALAAGRREFRVLGTQGAGSKAQAVPDQQSCVAIMTGAALPEGADTVIPVERITRSGDTATIEAGYAARVGQFVHRRASDHLACDLLLSAGTRLGPPETAILTIGGSATVTVARRPAIAVISTGDELVEAGQPIADHQIRSSNQHAITAALQARGFRQLTGRHLPDDEAVLARELGALLTSHDVMILTGGVSMGEFDYVPRVLARLGMTLVFHKVLQRPGLPLWFGLSADGKPVSALPGNPVSSLVCLARYVLPALDTALGTRPQPQPVVALAEAVRFEPDLAYFLPVCLDYTPEGRCRALPRPTNTSGDFVALKHTAGFVELPRGQTDFPAGFPAGFYPW